MRPPVTRRLVVVALAAATAVRPTNRPAARSRS